MSVSRDEILWCYRNLLGREPASEAEVEALLAQPDFKRLVERLAQFPEFAAARPAPAQERPLVSVVMPSFRQASFIEAAARSVLEQDWQPLELVVADGGSNDGTLQRLEGLLARFPGRLRWVSEPDAGPASAINKALRLARGEVVGWLNSDDLYAPGAAAAAVRHLLANPEVVMVYGEGEHIDAAGRPLGRYPTRPPAAGLQAFHDGCYICQPTVFLRRAVFDAVGLLDESFATAFDFELWLRIFKAFPGRIAHLDRVQACSRLHGDCITQTQRRQVAIEGVRALALHAGRPRPHWLLTYREELCASHPFGGEPDDLRRHFAEAIEAAAEGLGGDAVALLYAEAGRDMRLRLARPGAYAAVHADGWAGPELAVRLKGLPAGCAAVELDCLHQWPVFFPLSLSIETSWGAAQRVEVNEPGPFTLSVPLPPGAAAGAATILVRAKDSFVPCLADPLSHDARRLAFKVEALRLCGG